MNYGRYSITKRQKMLRSKRRRFYSFIKVSFLRVILLACVVVGIVGIFAGWGIYKGVISKSPNLDNISVVPTSYASTIYYSDGVTVAKTLAASGSNREYVAYSEISKNAINAFVALEDERFWNHNGIDIQGIFRVAFLDILTGADAGASTITQQLIKNQVFEGGDEDVFTDKVKRKIQEQYLAVELEAYTPKEKIIEYYLNTINLGNGTYGVQRASQQYFGKDALDLTVSEAAVLAPIAQSPTHQNPLTNPEANKRRRAATLKNMREQNYITDEEYDAAIADTEAVYERIRIQDQKESSFDSSTNSYFVDALINEVLSDLVATGKYDYQSATTLLYSGGLSIYTTQNKDVQKILDREFMDDTNFPQIGEGAYYELSKDWACSIYLGDDEWKHLHVKDLLEFYKEEPDSKNIYFHEKDTPRKGINTLTLDQKDLEDKIDAYIKAMMEETKGKSYMEASRNILIQPQTAMVVMDYANGDVLAIYGGRGKKNGDRVLNRATGTYRQPGSTFKVLAAFMPAMDTSGCTLASTFDDSYYYYGTGKEDKDADTTIKNWYSGYEGLTSIRRGIYHSMNIVAVRCFQSIGAGTSLSYLKQLNFKKLDETNDRNISTALGGLTNGVSVLELTAAYSSIANGGIYSKPRLYTKIVGHDGKTIIDNHEKYTQITKASTAALLTNAMQDTTTPKGTAAACAFKELKVDVAGKTGTSTNENDLWFCGFTPYLTAGIWSGYDNNHEQTATQYQKDLWRKCMEQIHELLGYTEGEFKLPASVTKETICSKCGKLAVSGLCDKNSAGNLITTEYFASGTAPTSRCTCCKSVTICKDSGMLATAGCPNTYTSILIDKEETEDSIKHGGTSDTKHCITSKMRQTCNKHSAATVTPDEGETPTEGSEAPAN